MKEYRRVAWAFILFGWAAVLAHSLSGCGLPLDPPYCPPPEVVALESYIVGGNPSVDRRSTAHLQGPDMSCTATIIGPHTALTAAHCGAATDLLVEDVAWFTITESIPHEDYAFPSNDLNILHTEEVLPEPYAPLATADVVCSVTIAQGYGRGGGGQLHEREVFEGGHLGDQIYVSTGIAPGDSGGPLYAFTDDGPVLLGVASWGWGSAPDFEGGTGFVSVPFHRDWIERNIR